MKWNLSQFTTAMIEQQHHLLDQYVAPGLRLWMLIGLVSAVLLVMIVIVCCFVRLRIPRTKRQIELRAAKRRKRKERLSGAGEHGDQHEGEHPQYRGGQTIVLNSYTGGAQGGGENGRWEGRDQIIASRSIPV